MIPYFVRTTYGTITFPKPAKTNSNAIKSYFLCETGPDALSDALVGPKEI